VPLPKAVTITTDSAALVSACDTILLSVPPAQAVQLGLDASEKLVLSVMAGVTLEQLSEITKTRRVIRAMSSPAATQRLAYSPYICAEHASDSDRALAHTLFKAIGLTDEITSEAQIDVFTAITGPVPGFVALFADAMVEYARGEGVPADIALRAIRQLFLSAGNTLGAGVPTPAEHVRHMIDYGGTTAAGLTAMQKAGIENLIGSGLAAATEKARKISRS